MPECNIPYCSPIYIGEGNDPEHQSVICIFKLLYDWFITKNQFFFNDCIANNSIDLNSPDGRYMYLIIMALWSLHTPSIVCAATKISIDLGFPLIYCLRNGIKQQLCLRQALWTTYAYAEQPMPYPIDKEAIHLRGSYHSLGITHNARAGNIRWGIYEVFQWFK